MSYSVLLTVALCLCAYGCAAWTSDLGITRRQQRQQQQQQPTTVQEIKTKRIGPGCSHYSSSSNNINNSPTAVALQQQQHAAAWNTVNQNMVQNDELILAALLELRDSWKQIETRTTSPSVVPSPVAISQPPRPAPVVPQKPPQQPQVAAAPLPPNPVKQETIPQSRAAAAAQPAVRQVAPVVVQERVFEKVKELEASWNEMRQLEDAVITDESANLAIAEAWNHVNQNMMENDETVLQLLQDVSASWKQIADSKEKAVVAAGASGAQSPPIPAPSLTPQQIPITGPPTTVPVASSPTPVVGTSPSFMEKQTPVSQPQPMAYTTASAAPQPPPVEAPPHTTADLAAVEASRAQAWNKIDTDMSSANQDLLDVLYEIRDSWQRIVTAKVAVPATTTKAVASASASTGASTTEQSVATVVAPPPPPGPIPAQIVPPPTQQGTQPLAPTTPSPPVAAAVIDEKPVHIGPPPPPPPVVESSSKKEAEAWRAVDKNMVESDEQILQLLSQIKDSWRAILQAETATEKSAIHMQDQYRVGDNDGVPGETIQLSTASVSASPAASAAASIPAPPPPPASSVPTTIPPPATMSQSSSSSSSTASVPINGPAGPAPVSSKAQAIVEALRAVSARRIENDQRIFGIVDDIRENWYMFSDKEEARIEQEMLLLQQRQQGTPQSSIQPITAAVTTPPPSPSPASVPNKQPPGQNLDSLIFDPKELLKEEERRPFRMSDLDFVGGIEEKKENKYDYDLASTIAMFLVSSAIGIVTPIVLVENQVITIPGLHLPSINNNNQVVKEQVQKAVKVEDYLNILKEATKPALDAQDSVSNKVVSTKPSAPVPSPLQSTKPSESVPIQLKITKPPMAFRSVFESTKPSVSVPSPQQTTKPPLAFRNPFESTKTALPVPKPIESTKPSLSAPNPQKLWGNFKSAVRETFIPPSPFEDE